MTEYLDVGMLGHSGAGKTSLLTSLYASFPELTRRTNLALASEDPITSAELSEYRTALESLGRKMKASEPVLSGTEELREHLFVLRRQDQRDDKGGFLRLRFTDYPGGWMTTKDREDATQLKNRLSESDILMVAIDTPARQAEDGRWHQQVNQVQRVRDMVSDWSHHRKRRLLLFVPLKCEAWTNNEQEAEQLSKDACEAYREAIQAAEASGNVGRIAVTPVQTVGSIEFTHFIVNDDHPVGYYKGKRINGQYSPMWAVEPLRQIVQVALKQRTKDRGLGTWIRDHITGDAGRMHEALKALAAQPLGPTYEPRPDQ